MNRGITVVLLSVGLTFLISGLAQSGAPEIGATVEVASEVEGTRQQRWPRAAWCRGAGCWLVAWREGEYAEGETDIYCGRVSAEGKTLDARGIRLTSAKGVQDRPAVASDGEGFLVVWSDFRNGRDWDVYAAVVSADGKVASPDGVLVAGGEHNQCYPTVAFAGGNYVVVWQSWVPDVVEGGGRAALKFGSYELRAARVSAKGSVLDRDSKKLAGATAIAPSIASDGSETAVLVWIGRNDRKLSPAAGLNNVPFAVRINAAKLEVLDAVRPVDAEKDSLNQLKQNQVPGLALLEQGQGVMLSVRGYKGGTTIFRLDKNAAKVGECVKIHQGGYDWIDVLSSLAAGGGRVLFTQDWPLPRTRGTSTRLGVWGWILSPDGRVLEGGADGFAIAADPAKDQVQGFACAGPGGTFLVVYADVKAPDNVKAAARVVKLGKE